MKREYGLSPTNKKNFLNRFNSLKLGGSLSPSKERKNSVTSKNDKNERKSFRVNNKPNLKKANKKILKFLSNCVEKIKDETKEDEQHITPHLAGVIEKQRFLKDNKKSIKKEVHINPDNLKAKGESNFQRAITKKSTNKKKKKFLSCRCQIYINKDKNLSNIGSEGTDILNSDYEKNLKKSNKTIKTLKRIATTRLAKEKEKEIVYNISSSLITLYKPNNKQMKSTFANYLNNINNKNINVINNKNKEPEKVKNKLVKKKSLSFVHSKNIKLKAKLTNINKRNSFANEEKFLSNFSTDSKTMKIPTHLKRFKTFIKPNNQKIKNLNHKRNSSKPDKKNSFFEPLFQTGKEHIINSNKSNKNKLENEEEKEKEKKELKKSLKNSKFHVLNWTEDLRNKENLTQGEYVHIEQDLIQSLIGYEKTKLEEELKNIENTETTDLIRKLPTLRHKKSNNDNSDLKEKFEDTLLNINMTDLNLKDNIKFDKEKFRFLQHTGYVYDSLDDEEIEDAIEINHCYISPDSIFIYIFDSLIAIISFYCLYYFPYYLAHDSFLISTILNIKIFIFHFIDFFYILDLIISFFRAYYNYDEILIKNIPDMNCNYLKNWFFLDFIAAIPFFTLFFFYEHKNISIKHFKKNLLKFHSFTHFGVKLDNMHYLLFLNKLLKIFKCFSDNNRALNKLIHILFQYNIIEEKSGLFFVIFILLESMHFGTCLFIFIGRNSYPSWIHTIGIENKTFNHIYISSLYYLIATITTVGYGDIYGRTIKEIFFQIILLIIGTCTYSFLISSVSNFIKKINEKSLSFEKKLKILNDIKLTNPSMEEGLYDKILRFLRYKKNTEKNKQTIIINSLPYSLKNSLLIEMYKPIINNFMIFKGLENSNCIVQLVTAFKPIYAIKNDILIQEGDFIEEVIFIKNGIICLEIGIDFNKPKESIEQYLNRLENKERSTVPLEFNTRKFDSNINTISDTSTFFHNMKSSIKEKKENIKNMHYLKVLDIRKNEHFGETLMFLNERSFLTAKVKSKKAELFFLKKEEVIKIFNSFPNIWNRINKKSIYNMKQIKITVKRVLLNFCSMSGINLNNKNKALNLIKNQKKIKKINKEKMNVENEDKKEKINLIDNNSDNTDNKNILIDEEKNKSCEDDQEVENQNEKNSSFNIFGKTPNESVSTFLANNSIQLNSFSKDKNNNTTYHNESNELSNITKNNYNFSCFRGIKNQSFKNFQFNKENSNKEEENENKYNSSKETVKVSINRKPCSIIDSDSIYEENELIGINYEVNDEIYKDENFNLYFETKNDLLKNNKIIESYLNNNIKIENLSRKILEKTWLNNLDKEKRTFLEKVINKNTENKIIEKINEKENSKKRKNHNISFNSSSSSSINLSKLKTSEVESFQIKYK